MRLTLAIAALMASAHVAGAAGFVDRQACLAKGNTASQCECFESRVDKGVRAGVKPETYQSMRKGGGGGTASDDLTAMGVMIDATATAAKACGVKLK